MSTNIGLQLLLSAPDKSSAACLPFAWLLQHFTFCPSIYLYLEELNICPSEKADLLPRRYSSIFAAAVRTLKVEPGSYTSHTSPFLERELRRERSSRGISLRSNEGFTHIARIAPLLGSNTSISADFAEWTFIASSIAASHKLCISASMVSLRLSPSVAGT